MRLDHRGCSVVLSALILVGPLGPSAARATEPAPTGTALEESTAKRGKVYAHFMRALLVQRRGEYRAAAAEIRRAIELMPDSADVLVEGALLLERMGRIQDAEELGRRALQLAPDHPQALRFLADLIAARTFRPGREDPKSREEALALYQRLIDQGVEDEQMLRRVISLRIQAEDREGALAAARELVEQRPGDRHATGLLAQILLEGGEHREALRVLLSFIAGHPGDAQLIRLAQNLARELDAWNLVEEEFAAQGGLADRAVDAHRLLGEALLQLDRIEPASRSLEKVLLSDPTDRAVRYTLAAAYRRMGRLGEAARLMRELVGEAPGDGRAHLMLAEILDQQADVEGALNAFNTALRLYSTEREEHPGSEIRESIRRRMALLYTANQQYEAARRLVEEFEAAEEPEALHVRARLALAMESWSEARQAARTLRARGENGVAALIEGEVQLRTGRADRAVPKFAEAIEALGGLTRARVAELYLELDRVDQGAALLREWVEREPDNADARFQLGSFLYRAERLEASEPELREAFRIDPQHAAALNFLGYSLAERTTNLDEALELIERAIQVDAWNGAYLDSLGWAYYQMGRYAEAREPLEQAALTYPKDAVVLEHLGDLYVKLGEFELALAAWQRALEAGPEDAEALRTKIEIVEVAADEGQPNAGQRTEPAPPNDTSSPRRR